MCVARSFNKEISRPPKDGLHSVVRQRGVHTYAVEHPLFE